MSLLIIDEDGPRMDGSKPGSWPFHALYTVLTLGFLYPHKIIVTSITYWGNNVVEFHK